MLHPLVAAERYAAQGLKSLLVASWSAATYVYASAERSLITGISGVSDWQRFPVSDGSAFGEEVSRQLRGRQAVQRVSLAPYPGLSTDNYTALETLLGAGPVLVLCQALDGSWWLYGQDFGLRLPKYVAQDGYSLELSGLQRQGARRVADSVITSLLTPAAPSVVWVSVVAS